MTLSSRLLLIMLPFFTYFSCVFGGLTTTQHNDPAPWFSANDSMVPPNAQFLDLFQARYKHEKPNKKRFFGLNISGFLQGAVSGYGHSGNTQFGTVTGFAQDGFELGDFRGTMYVMGLFLGRNPDNGASIWTDDLTYDSGNVNDITTDSVAAFFNGKKACLEDIVNILNDNLDVAPNANALIFYYVPLDSSSGTPMCPETLPTDITYPSIFTSGQLASDDIYFGAHSLPIDYHKQGMRLEANINVGDNIGLTIQTGFVNIKQRFVPDYLSQSSSPGNTMVGAYSLSDTNNVCPAVASGGTATPPCPFTQPLSPLYLLLNTALAPSCPQPTNNPPVSGSISGQTFVPSQAQEIFDTNISNNLGWILNKECGHDQLALPFDEYSMEDLRVTLHIKHPHDTNKHLKNNSQDQDGKWSDMLLTPFAWIGGSFPLAREVDYCNLLSMPFGNNGHASLGGGAGMTFDFAESIEVGFEAGATYFFSKDEYRPFPTHALQRLLYPFKAHVNTTPGINGHFKGLISAYQFISHVNFWFVYEVIDHRQDCFRILEEPTKAQYYVPEVITKRSDWRVQYFNAGLSFDIQPGLQASLVWQQPIAVTNAYYPITITGSINFFF